MAALDGILVVALEQAVAAPLCTQRLVEAGARVIKVERAQGDFARAYDRAVAGESAYFVWLNHSKESLVLDIKQADEAALLARIIAMADVFVQNLAPGAAARAGFGSDALRARHPALITCDISGYAQDGPAGTRKAYDLLIQCETGLASVTGVPEAPGRVGVSVADIACGMNAHAAILEALLERGRTGCGSGIEVSLFDALAEWMTVPLLHQDHAGAAPARVGLAHPSIAPYGVFSCRDGRSLVIAVQNEREWQTFCSAILEQPALATVPEFAGNERRVAHRVLIDGIIAAAFAGIDHDVLTARLDAAGIAFGSVNDVGGLAHHVALRRRSVAAPGGMVALPSPAIRFAGRTPRPGAVPALGAQSHAIREEFA